MKKICLLFAVILCTANAFSQTLFTYGSNTVSKDEFLKAYNKNKTPVTDKEKSLRAYLDLYTNFKLKVKAAREIRLDTLQQIKNDVENFRQQIQDNYVGDEQMIKSLSDEAYTRGLTDLHVMHFSVPVDASASPADTLKAFQAANMLYTELKSGNPDHTSIVEKVSVQSKAKSNDL